jgi:hypothetical protein
MDAPDQPYNWLDNPNPVFGGAPGLTNQPGSGSVDDQQPPSGLANLVTNQQYGWGMTIEWTTDMGLRSSPVAAGALAQNEQFWRAHAGSQLKVISCVAEAIEQNPMMPSPNTQNDNDVLIAWRLVNVVPCAFIDLKRVFCTFLVLVYRLQRPLTLGVDVFDFGASVFDNIPAASNVLIPQDFYPYLSQASAVTGFQGGPITF